MFKKKRGNLGNDLPSSCMFVSRLKASFVVSGSQDCTVKVWDLPADLSTTEADIHQLTPRATEKAHDKVQAHFRTEGKSLQLFVANGQRTRKIYCRLHVCMTTVFLATCQPSEKVYFCCKTCADCEPCT